MSDEGNVPEADPEVEVRVDPGRCMGIGQCEMLEPDVFEIDDDMGVAAAREGALLPRSRATVVVGRCPSGAISVVEADAVGE